MSIRYIFFYITIMVLILLILLFLLIINVSIKNVGFIGSTHNLYQFIAIIKRSLACYIRGENRLGFYFLSFFFLFN
jgi:uncharacterized integral membrane protein